MAKRNRRRKTLSLRPANVGLAVLAFLGVAPWCMYCLTRTSAAQIDDRANVLENEKRVYEQMLSREQAAWNNAKEPKRLAEAIERTGLSLNYPSPECVVHVSASGSMRASPSLVKAVADARAARLQEREGGAIASGVRTARSRTSTRRRR